MPGPAMRAQGAPRGCAEGGEQTQGPLLPGVWAPFPLALGEMRVSEDDQGSHRQQEGNHKF